MDAREERVRRSNTESFEDASFSVPREHETESDRVRNFETPIRLHLQLPILTHVSMCSPAFGLPI